MAVGPFAIEQSAQTVMGQLEGIFPLPSQGLQVELALQCDLVGLQSGPPHHLQEQGQQDIGILGGAMQPDHQGVLTGLRPQGGSAPLDEIGHGFGIQGTATPGHQSGQ